jgi:Phage integrase central domain
VADIQKRVTSAGEVRWDVRYRDDTRRQRKRSFDRKLDAQRFARSVETDLLRGDWIDPRRAHEPFEQWAASWMATLGNRKPKTRENYESIVSRHLLPRFATTPIGAIDYPRVLAFVADLQQAGAGPGTIRNIRDVLRLVLAFAVRSGALKSNPVAEVEVQRTGRAEMIFLDPDQIMALAREVTAPPFEAPGVTGPSLLTFAGQGNPQADPPLLSLGDNEGVSLDNAAISTDNGRWLREALDAVPHPVIALALNDIALGASPDLGMSMWGTDLAGVSFSQPSTQLPGDRSRRAGRGAEASAS